MLHSVRLDSTDLHTGAQRPWQPGEGKSSRRSDPPFPASLSPGVCESVHGVLSHPLAARADDASCLGEQCSTPKVDECAAVSGRSRWLESSLRDCSADPLRKVGHSAGWALFKQSINESNGGRGTFSQEKSSSGRLLVSGEGRRPAVMVRGTGLLPGRLHPLGLGV